MSDSQDYSEDEYKDADENRAEDNDEDETMDEETEDENETRDENKDETSEDEEEDGTRAEDEDEGEDGTRDEVPIQHRRRGTRSIRLRTQNKGAFKSTIWAHFDTKTAKYPGRPVCQKCKAVFSSASGTTTLKRHLSSHKIAAPRMRQSTMHDYRTDPYPKNEQDERDILVANWVVCDIQPFSVVENEEWRQMITKFDPRYQFHN